MHAIMDKLFNYDEDKVILSTFTNDYTARDIKEMVLFYEDMLKDKEISGKRVCLIIPSINTYLAIALAVNNLGGTIIPLSWQYRKEDLTAVMEFLNPHIIFTIKELNQFSFSDTLQNWASESKMETIIFDSEDNTNWDKHFFDGETRQLEEKKIEFICSSSGSTGTPKGMVLQNNILDAAYDLFPRYMDFQQTDNVFLIAPPTGIFGLTTFFYGIQSGAKIVFAENFDLLKIIGMLDQHQCNKIIGTPSLLKAIYQVAKGVKPAVMENFDWVVLGGEKIPHDFLEQIALSDECKVMTLYGSTEGGAIAYNNFRETSLYSIVEGNEYKLQDGELLVKSQTAFKEYYQNPSLTSEVFDEDGWLYTGDIADIKADGTFDIVGRKKEMIKKGGQAVFSGEIEQTLIHHENVKQAVVFGVPHAIYGEEIIAFIVPDGEVDSKELTYYCSQRIAAYKVPDQIKFIDEFPVTQGKVDKITLKKIHSGTV